MAIEQAIALQRLDDLKNLFRGFGFELRTEPYAHQVEGFWRNQEHQEAFAQLGEQGTGKTWILIHDAVNLFAEKKINAALVLAPKGVDSNWLHDEIPRHIPVGVQWTAALWRASARKKQRIDLGRISGRRIDFQFDEKKDDSSFKWLLMNWDAISTQRGFEFAMEFLERNQAIVICDEAQRIKAPESKRSKALLKIKEYAPYRRIATGTPILNSPFDAFMPFLFLDEDILGSSSFFSFKGEYATMIGPSNPLYWGLLKKMAAKVPGMTLEEAKKKFARRIPQIVEKDEMDRPLYKNLDRLQDKVSSYSYRVLKKDCLDLPEKIYKKLYFDLTEEQEKIYLNARDNLRIEIDSETIQPLMALTKIQKMAQIASGFFIETAEGIVHEIPGGNPKQELLEDLLGDIDGKAIIWANFKAEMNHIRTAAIRANKICVEYHGGVSEAERKNSIEQFQNGNADVFIGHPKSGGTGLTLHAASNVIYYSNSYSLEARLQSEDRAHRIGQKNNVIYWDLVAEDTIEERIIEALQMKTDLAALINGDLLR